LQIPVQYWTARVSSRHARRLRPSRRLTLSGNRGMINRQ
jgi:hypothetical protein